MAVVQAFRLVNYHLDPKRFGLGCGGFFAAQINARGRHEHVKIYAIIQFGK